MTKLEQLIQELCPHGVEAKQVDEVCDISRGRVISKEYIGDHAGAYPVYSSQTEHEGVLGLISTYDYDGEYLTWTTDGANAGTVFYRHGRFSITNVCGLLTVKSEYVLTRYLFHVLTIEVPKYVHKGMGNPKLMSHVMARIQIAIPPLEVQREIVRILDHFTELTAELTTKLATELTARKKQYGYYCDKLFDVGSYRMLQIKNIATTSIEMEYRKLSEVTTIKRGKRVVREQLSHDCGYPVFQNSLIPMGFHSDSNYPAGTTYVIGAGAAGGIGYCTEDFWAADDCFPIVCSDAIISRYVFHFLRRQQPMLLSKVRKASIPRLSREVIENLVIPVPPLEVQREIVRILDHFMELTEELATNLTTELTARQKQYEYYRDRLLAFPKP